jgi:hypothetical protein
MVAAHSEKGDNFPFYSSAAGKSRQKPEAWSLELLFVVEPLFFIM